MKFQVKTRRFDYDQGAIYDNKQQTFLILFPCYTSILKVTSGAYLLSYIMLKIERNQDIGAGSEWHAVPASLTNSEPIENAKINHYFRPTISKENGLSASLQGHLLKGTIHNPKNLFKAITYKPDDTKEDIEIVLTEKVGEIVDWRKDISWGSYEGYIGTLEKYVAIQQALHSQ